MSDMNEARRALADACRRMEAATKSVEEHLTDDALRELVDASIAAREAHDKLLLAALARARKLPQKSLETQPHKGEHHG